MFFLRKVLIYSKNFLISAFRPLSLTFICFTHHHIFFEEEKLKLRVLFTLWPRYKKITVFLAVSSLCSGPFAPLVLMILFHVNYGFRFLILFNLLVLMVDLYLVKFRVPMPLSKDLYLIFVSSSSCYSRYQSLVKEKKEKK